MKTSKYIAVLPGVKIILDGTSIYPQIQENMFCHVFNFLTNMAFFPRGVTLSPIIMEVEMALFEGQLLLEGPNF